MLHTCKLPNNGHSATRPTVLAMCLKGNVGDPHFNGQSIKGVSYWLPCTLSTLGTTGCPSNIILRRRPVINSLSLWHAHLKIVLNCTRNVSLQAVHTKVGVWRPSLAALHRRRVLDSSQQTLSYFLMRVCIYLPSGAEKATCSLARQQK